MSGSARTLITVAAIALVAHTGVGAALAQGAGQTQKPPLVVLSQGNRTFGGRVVTDAAAGTRLSCDHGYVNWQIPVNPRRYPLLMVHASSKRTWETTWTGQEGFRDIFLRRGFSTWITDLPRTGQAGQGCGATAYTPALSDKSRFNSWRLGLWFLAEASPRWYPGVQFPTGNAAALDQFSRIQTPEFNAPENEQVETDALTVLLNEIGPSVVLTHSSTGIRGWITGIKSDKVAGIVSYEPGAVVFPQGELPPPVPRADGTIVVLGREVPMADFLKLTKYPIQILWGDYIPKTLDAVNVGERLTLDSRRINVLRSKLFVEAINRHGGDAQNLILPDDLGIKGNTHFLMLDDNIGQIADLLSQFLSEKGLDRRSAEGRSRLDVVKGTSN
jgi:hypothetical protein